MGGMNRRGFLRSLGAAAVGLTLARCLPGIVPKPPALAFHPDAFSMAMGDPGIGERILTRYTNDAGVARVDVLLGWSTLKSEVRFQ